MHKCLYWKASACVKKRKEKKYRNENHAYAMKEDSRQMCAAADNIGRPWTSKKQAKKKLMKNMPTYVRDTHMYEEV